MNRLLPRLFALIFIPCLVIDLSTVPALASFIHSNGNAERTLPSPISLEEQAMANVAFSSWQFVGRRDRARVARGAPWNAQENSNPPLEAVEQVRRALQQHRPEIMERYAHMRDLSPTEEQGLINQIYQIRAAHLRLWTSDRLLKIFPNGYVGALRAIFPDLHLDARGFNLIWTSPEESIASVRFVLARERPDLLRRYDALDSSNPPAVRALAREVYGISDAHFGAWDLDRALDRRTCPYFEGSYAAVLQAVFPNLHLNHLGFRPHWNSEADAVVYIRYVLSQEMPSLIERYDYLDTLSAAQRSALENDIYRISRGHFKMWDLDSGMANKRLFGNSYVKALQAVFPRLHLNRYGFASDWTKKDWAIESIRYALDREIPTIMAQYNRIDLLGPAEIENLRQGIYAIKQSDFLVWKIGSALVPRVAPYFHGHYIEALLAVFSNPALGITEDGFRQYRREHTESRYSWSGGYHDAVANVQGAIIYYRPALWDAYKSWESLRPEERESVKRSFYEIHVAHFRSWGLTRAIIKEVVPEFEQSYIEALRQAFPELDLDPLGFCLDWSTPERGLASMEFILHRERPDLLERYADRAELGEDDLRDLRADIYHLTAGHFEAWGLAGGLTARANKSPLFEGSHIAALQALFPALHLNPLGFQLDWSSPERAMASVQYVMAERRPDLMERYQRLGSSSREREDLKEDIYAIDQGRLMVIGLAGALTGKASEYFHGHYWEVLQAAFPDLDLDPLGWQLDWTAPERALASIRYNLQREEPRLVDQLDRISSLAVDELREFRRDVTHISGDHLNTWGLGALAQRKICPYFGGSYIEALLGFFNHPRLNLRLIDFKGFTGYEVYRDGELIHRYPTGLSVEQLGTLTNVHLHGRLNSRGGLYIAGKSWIQKAAYAFAEVDVVVEDGIPVRLTIVKDQEDHEINLVVSIHSMPAERALFEST